MVLEDNEDIQKLFEIKLKKLGHTYLPMYDGEEAIKIYRDMAEVNDPIDIVILDLNLQASIDGQQVAKSILVFDPEARIIVSSGDTENIVMKNYQDYGFKAALDKDLDPQKIEFALQKALK